MRNSINDVFTEMSRNVAKAKVIEWPMVNAVTRIKIFFQSRTRYTAHKATTNRI